MIEKNFDLLTLIKLLYSTVEHVTRIVVKNQNIEINKRDIYEMRLYKNMNKVETQFARRYTEDEEDLDLSKFKNIKILLNTKSRREVIMITFWDDDVDEITL